MDGKRSDLKIGLALGAGGARGWCHIGVLRELDAMGLAPDVIAGSSMGALVGAVYAGGALDALEEWARTLTARSFVGMLDVRLSSGGLVEGREINRTIARFVGGRNIEDLVPESALVATDMETGREVWLTEGEVAKAVRASAALPGVLSPHLVDGRWMLDGGLTNPVPVSACHMLGADIVIAVNPNGRPDGIFWTAGSAGRESNFPGWRDRLPEAIADFIAPRQDGPVPPSYIEVLATTIDVVTNGIMRSKLAGDPPHVLLEADLGHITVLEFHRAAEAIEEGRRVARESAEAIARFAGL